MSERKAILDLWRSRKDGSGILVTLVGVEGSSYRRPGARMFIQAGEYAGSISGGCLEGEVFRKAQWLTRDGAAVETYSTRFENPLDGAASATLTAPVPLDERDIPYGLGCGGVLDLLLEPARLPETEAMLRALDAAQQGESFYCATQLPSGDASGAMFSRVILKEDGSTFFVSEHLAAGELGKLRRLAFEASLPASADKTPRDVFVECIQPPQRLVIFGAGEDARPLARMAHLLGWRVAVADGRAWLAEATRFPEAGLVVPLSAHAENLDRLQLSPRDAVAVLTHSFIQDRRILPKLLPLNLRYLGLLGARHRSQLLLAEAAQELGWKMEECARRVHAPIGLDVGGDGPEAVALAILSEIQSVLHGRNAASRRTAEDARISSANSTYVPAQCSFDAPSSTVG